MNGVVAVLLVAFLLWSAAASGFIVGEVRTRRQMAVNAAACVLMAVGVAYLAGWIGGAS